jgi:hypothetical protein
MLIYRGHLYRQAAEIPSVEEELAANAALVQDTQATPKPEKEVPASDEIRVEDYYTPILRKIRTDHLDLPGEGNLGAVFFDKKEPPKVTNKSGDLESGFEMYGTFMTKEPLDESKFGPGPAYKFSAEILPKKKKDRKPEEKIDDEISSIVVGNL